MTQKFRVKGEICLKTKPDKRWRILDAYDDACYIKEVGGLDFSIVEYDVLDRDWQPYKKPCGQKKAVPQEGEDNFGNKIESERRDYERLRQAGIRIPEMIAIDEETERVVKEYIAGETVFELVKDGRSAEPYLRQVREMAEKARKAGLNIDYFPTNFVIRDGLIWYVDYECNEYMEEWNFENWGIKYWSRTPEFEEYVKQHERTE